MRIALIAPPWYTVPPQGYGGIELVVYLLARELQLRGHGVSVFACRGSSSELDVRALADEDWHDDLGTPDQRVREATYLRRVYTQVKAGDFDLVHEHTEYPGMMIAHTLGIDRPVVATLHNRITSKEVVFLREVEHEIGLVAISEAQRAQAPELVWNSVVHNAIDVDRLGFSAEKLPYLVQVARICSDKGQHISIEVAKRLGLSLILAGKVDRDEASQHYFESEIRPQLGGRVRWIEDVQGEDKVRLVANAQAALFPLQWEEPFGLAMAEAMASGTPVVAFPRGAAVELIEPGVNGFLAEDVDDMARLVEEVGSIDPDRCAITTRERFGARSMADGYERAYAKAFELNRAPLVASPG
jgi:glycosyltransferase involved in cell wall biosynthesis